MNENSVEKIFKNEIVKNISVHVIGWILLISLVSVFWGKDLGDFNRLIEYSAVWLVYIAIFYLNFLWLLPNIVIKGRRIFFFVLTILMLLSGYYVNDEIKQGLFKPNRDEYQKRRPISNEEIDQKARPKPKPIPKDDYQKRRPRPNEEIDQKARPKPKPIPESSLFFLEGLTILFLQQKIRLLPICSILI